MSYRNKTYVAFASEDIKQYYMMIAWKTNENIDFDFYDAHDLHVSRDTSKPETIKANLRLRMKNAKQIVLLGSAHAKRKGGDGDSFLAHEIEVMMEFNLPIVVANLNGDRKVDKAFIPQPLLDASYYTLSTSFQPKIIQYALDGYAAKFSVNKTTQKGPHQYAAEHYTKLGL
jgi:hypothetical protein